jgi:D-aminoacyl-tRNA deacylase
MAVLGSAEPHSVTLSTACASKHSEAKVAPIGVAVTTDSYPEPAIDLRAAWSCPGVLRAPDPRFARKRECYPETAMRAVVQRVSRASVAVDGLVVGEIGPGLLVLLGVSTSDVEADADYLAEKIAGLRIFEDHDGKMNRSVADVGGAVLTVSQFTLYGDVRRGKRPSFDDAARPERARELYEYFVAQIRRRGLSCQSGQFQAMMSVSLVNQGPVTVLLDSSKLF